MEIKSRNLRFLFFVIITALLFLLALGHYFSLMVLQNKGGNQAAAVNPVIERGYILDRNGEKLAIQNRLYSVTAWKPNIKDVKQTAQLLSPILDIKAQDIVEQLNQPKNFFYLKRKISPTETQSIKELQKQGELKGIFLEPEYGRIYPNKRLASHVLGYVGMDNVGLSGIEQAYDSLLSPEAGKNEKIVNGNHVFLTIDKNIQYEAEKIARKAYTQYDADSVMLLIMEADTGDFLAYASMPDFDPNSFEKFSESERNNRPISTSYEPGSVFKIFSIASFLEIGALTPDQYFNCQGFYELRESDDEVEHIRCLGVHGLVNAQKILKLSCNAGAAYASEGATQEDFYGMLVKFGFGSPTGLPFPGETHGILHHYTEWSFRSKPTIAFGQEIGVSAVQIVSAATALTNGGKRLKPNIVQKVMSQDGTIIEESHPQPLVEVISPAVAKNILLMMETATEPGGTATRAKVDGIRTSAKTGTAQMLDPKTGKYSTKAYMASCLSIFPTDHPKLIIYLAIEYPKGKEYYGGRIAAPLVKEISEQLVYDLDILQEGDSFIEHPGTVYIPVPKPILLNDKVPDLIGRSKKDLYPLIQREDINLIIRGDGWVIRQNPPAGTALKKGMTISVELQ